MGTVKNLTQLKKQYNTSISILNSTVWPITSSPKMKPSKPTRKPCIFITMLRQTVFVKLHDLLSPNDIVMLTLDQVVALLTAHYWPQTIEISERYKFSKHTQEDQERTTDFIAP